MLMLGAGRGVCSRSLEAAAAALARRTPRRGAEVQSQALGQRLAAMPGLQLQLGSRCLEAAGPSAQLDACAARKPASHGAHSLCSHSPPCAAPPSRKPGHGALSLQCSPSRSTPLHCLAGKAHFAAAGAAAASLALRAGASTRPLPLRVASQLPRDGARRFSSCGGDSRPRETRRHRRMPGARARAVAWEEAVGEREREGRPELTAVVVLEDDLKSTTFDEAFEESVSHDAQVLLSESWGLILEKLGEETADAAEPADNAPVVAGGGDSPMRDVESVELSVLLCTDSYIQSLNAQWRGVEKPTDVLSFPQYHADAPETPTVLLGDIVISLETAERQAEERGHTLRDEIRILLVHGLLHLLGMDHEESAQAEQDMQQEEQHLLAVLGWHVEGLIASAARATSDAVGAAASPRRAWKPPFRLLLCDMDGTLLNSSSKISPCTAEALRAASACGVQVAIATGKARPAAMAALATAGLAGEEGVISHQSPGVFIQGLRVYGEGGSVVHNALLPTHVVAQAFQFSLKYDVALIGFSGDHCVTMRDHPLVEALHTRYYEPRARVYSSIDMILNEAPIQKLLFYDTEEGISEFVRPYWSKHLSIDEAALTQAVPDMLEILPPGQSKGSGVKVLLDSMGIHPDDVMALGDGENDKEMLEMVGWGVAMGNGSPITKAVAKAVVGSNDDGGIAEAINKFILS